MANLGGEDQLFKPGKAEGRRRPTPPAGADKTFRRYDPHQVFLLPPSLDDWLGEDHEARFISEIVEEVLDLGVIYASYENATGAPPYDPRLMLKVLLYGYSTGVTSSREMERRCHLDVAFRWLSANSAPDYRSISRFRRRHLDALNDLFVQVLALCFEAGLVRLGRVALDGTKLRASASRHKARSYDRIGPKIEQLETEVAAILAEAEAVDNAEDVEFGAARRGDEVPNELARRETRLVKLRAAKKAIEREAAEKAAEKAAATAKEAGADESAQHRAAVAAARKAKPEGRAQRSFTDPDARIMKSADGSFQYCFNAQAVVDEGQQVILAAELGNNAADVGALVPMIEAAEENLHAAGAEKSPEVVVADAGYCSEANLTEAPGDVLVATGRIRRGEVVPESPRGRIPNNATPRELMARRLRTKKGRADYARRKAIVEPAFGQMKVRQQAGFLRLRGLQGAQGEWMLHALCHNLRKLGNARAKELAAT